MNKNKHRGVRRLKKAGKKDVNEDSEEVTKKYASLSEVDPTTFTSFRDFPLSQKTIKGLEGCNFTVPTEIQRDSLAYSLTGSDVVGAAKTGSGKTVAFVVPLLELLWRNRWSKMDGLGAIIISPTRELAMQTFQTISKVGKYHDFSACLLIGGTDFEYEKRRLGVINIVVCTPGRLLQHLDENEFLQSANLQLLVIDEADRILDMGFRDQMNAIMENMPQDRQTLLFSATQTNDVHELSRVCTRNPVFVSVHEKAANATPDSLKQMYVSCEEHEKITVLWSFLTKHRHSKILVFVSSCKQARFLTEVLCHLRPGISLMGLWGTMNQNRRINVLSTFERRKAACLISTDVASRGLDISGLDWVFQMDAPPTVDDYVHRVGRTARLDRKGNAVLLLTPRQTAFLDHLERIPLTQSFVDHSSMIDIQRKLQSCLAQFPELNELGRKAVVAYLRSIHMMKNKKVFNVDSIDVKKYSESFGIMVLKRIRFLNKQKGGKQTKEKDEQEKKTVGAMFELDDDIELFTMKKAGNVEEHEEKSEKSEKNGKGGALQEKKKVILKATLAKSLLRKGVTPLKKTFDEEGNAKEQEVGGATLGLDLKKAMEEQPERDKIDKIAYRQAMKEKRKAKKLKKRKRRQSEEDMDMGESDEQDLDLSWLPDPDKPKDEEEPTIKRRRLSNIQDAEAEALALLSRKA